MKTNYVDNTEFQEIIEKFQKYKRNKFRTEILLNHQQDLCERKKTFNNLNKEDEELLNSLKLESSENQKQFEFYQNKLTSELYKISENIARFSKFKFRNVDDAFVDDAIQEGVMVCLDKVDRFDPDRGSKAFNYMSTCIFHHFKQMYRSSKSYQELKVKYYGHMQSIHSKTLIRNHKEVSVLKN